MAIEKVAFTAGFGTGLLIGIELKTVQDVSREGISLTIIQTFCSSAQKIPNSPCDLLWAFGLVFLLAGLFTIASDYKKNGFLYGLGFIFGILVTR
ncbi:MAG: hypothetical protein V1835_01975 [Candidatus Micrarchaeota archaeon]